MKTSWRILRIAPAATGASTHQCLTPHSLLRVRNEEKKLVRKECGGKYLVGEECGFDTAHHLRAGFRAFLWPSTISSSRQAVIEYAWRTAVVRCTTRWSGQERLAIDGLPARRSEVQLTSANSDGVSLQFAIRICFTKSSRAVGRQSSICRWA